MPAVPWLFNKLPTLYESEGSLLCSQHPATCPELG